MKNIILKLNNDEYRKALEDGPQPELFKAIDDLILAIEKYYKDDVVYNMSINGTLKDEYHNYDDLGCLEIKIIHNDETEE